MTIVSVGPMVIPAPEGVEFSTVDKFAENLKLLKPINFIAPWLAHAMGTLIGAFVAAKIAASHKMKFAMGISTFFLLGGVMMVSMFGGPIWFAVLDLLGRLSAHGIPRRHLGRSNCSNCFPGPWSISTGSIIDGQ